MSGLPKRSICFVLLMSLISLLSSCGETAAPRHQSNSSSEALILESRRDSLRLNSNGSQQQPDQAEQNPRGMSTSPNQFIYQCNAWPITNPSIWTYWIHWDVVFAAKTAVNACWSRTRLPCTYNCFRVQ